MKKYKWCLVAIVLLSGLFGFHVTSVSAADIYLPVIDGKIIIDSSMYVRAGDVLHIPIGSRIFIESGGSIYAKGDVFIGVDQGIAISTYSPVTQSDSSVHIYSKSTGVAFQIDGGNLIMLNTVFEGNLFLEAYRSADISISGSVIKDTRSKADEQVRPVISVFNHSTIDVSYSSISSSLPEAYISNRSTLIELFNYASSTFSNVSVISQVSNNVFGIYSSSSLQIQSSIITSCNTWFNIYMNSVASGEVNQSICNSSPESLFSNGKSNIHYTYSPCCSSVLFLPGVQASRLSRFKSGQSKLWEPSSIQDIDYLTLSAGGTSSKQVIPTSVISELKLYGLSFFPIYKKLISEFSTMKGDGVIKEFILYPYDWRQAPETIVTDDFIKNVESMAASSYSGKVSIVAHSYGGLVTKELLRKLKSLNKSHLVDKVVMVAVPETGAPSALVSLLHGYDLQVFKGLIVNTDTMAKFVQHMPSVYRLLPVQSYAQAIEFLFKDQRLLIAKPVSISSIYSWFNNKIQSNWNIRNTGDLLSTPYMLKNDDVSLSQSYTNASNRWQSEFNEINSAYRVWSIIGTGLPTVSAMAYESGICKIVCPKKTIYAKPIYSVDGDGTVILDSIINRLGHTIIFNLGLLNLDKNINIRHANIFESQDVVHLINQILISDSIGTQASYIVDVEQEKRNKTRVYQLIFDKDLMGGFTALNKSTGQVLKDGSFVSVDDIPGSSIDMLGSSVFINSLVQPDKIEIMSTKNIRTSITYQVSEKPNVYVSTTTPQVEIASNLIFKDIIIPSGTTVVIQPTQHNAVVDINKNGILDDSDSIYSASNLASSTYSGTPFASTTTSMLCRQDIDKLMNYAKSATTTFSLVHNASLKLKYQAENKKILDLLLKINSELSNYENHENCINTKTGKWLVGIFDITTKSEDRLSELDTGYTTILSSTRSISVFPFNLFPILKIANRKNETASNQQDSQVLFVYFAHLSRYILEFSETYGNI